MRSDWPGCNVALAEFEHGDEVTVVHRSFELDPHAPASSPGTSAEAVARKYGMRPEQVRAGHAQLTAFGAEVGFTFDFDRVRRGNTFDAHRLTQAARGTEWEDALVRRLFDAHFGEGRLLSDHDVLRDVARSVGLPEGITERCSEATTTAKRCVRTRPPPRNSDVTGVPYFLIDGAWPVPGAQDVETLGVLLRTAPGHASAIESRISSTISRVVLGWRKAKRATVSPSHVVGVTKPICALSRRGGPGLVVGLVPSRPPEEDDGEPGVAHQLDVG